MIIVEVLYLLSVTLLAVYGVNTFVHTCLYWRRRRMKGSSPEAHRATPRENMDAAFNSLPVVTVQLPIYNERHVAARLIDAVANLEWPPDRLQIQVLDDSTDDTSQIIQAALVRYQNRGAKLEHIRRSDRRGFKAGALQVGLATARGEFIAIFDADFIPPPHFLRATILCFGAADVGCVQTRWGHVNPNTSGLTQSQALGIDGHFAIEQFARHTIGAFLNFNGTAGVWRRACMEDAGGWQGDTLTEDLDLSYRAQLRGWRIVYKPDVIVPAELPVQIDALKRQQFRWAKGSIQTAMKLLGALWRSQQPFWRKVLGTLHLTNYSVHPLMVINVLFLLPVSFSHSPLLHFAPILTLAAVGPPAMYWAAMEARGEAWPLRLRRLAMLMALGTGLSINNTKATFEAVARIPSEFKRTPKFAVTERFTSWQTSSYALPHDPTVWLETALAIYALGLLLYSIASGAWWLIIWVLLYAGGYSYIACLAFAQARQLHKSHASTAHGAASEWATPEQPTLPSERL